MTELRHNNAETMTDLVYFHCAVGKADALQRLRAFLELLAAGIVDETRLTTEIPRILEERAQVERFEEALFRNRLAERLFGPEAHRVSKADLGLTTAGGLTGPTITRWWSLHVSPDRISILVDGDHTPEEVRAATTGLAWRKVTGRNPLPDLPLADTPPSVIEGERSRARIGMAFRVLRHDPVHREAVELLLRRFRSRSPIIRVPEAHWETGGTTASLAILSWKSPPAETPVSDWPVEFLKVMRAAAEPEVRRLERWGARPRSRPQLESVAVGDASLENRLQSLIDFAITLGAPPLPDEPPTAQAIRDQMLSWLEPSNHRFLTWTNR